MDAVIRASLKMSIKRNTSCVTIMRTAIHIIIIASGLEQGQMFLGMVQGLRVLM